MSDRQNNTACCVDQEELAELLDHSVDDLDGSSAAGARLQGELPTPALSAGQSPGPGAGTGQRGSEWCSRMASVAAGETVCRVDRKKGGRQMPGKLTVQVVGTFAVRRGNSVLTGADISSRKARLLLALLAVERGHWISTDRITGALWPDRPARRPARNVATLVSRLRGRFGPDLVEGGKTMYRLGGHVAVDLNDAAELVSMAERGEDSGVVPPAARQALDLLEHADVLCAEPHAKWAEPAREQRTMLVRRARLAAANSALHAGELSAAREVAERAVADDAFDEAAHRTLMLVHAASGEPARALIAYERLRRTLADELGTYPATATRDLHVDILRGRSPMALPKV